MRITFKNNQQAYQTLMPSKQAEKQVSFEGKTSLSDKGMQALSNYGQYLVFRGQADSLKPVNVVEKKPPLAERLVAVREEMKKAGQLDGLIERSTDEYLSETVDKNQSESIWISGFDGSGSEVLITPKKAHLIVDGRWHKEADEKADKKNYIIEKAGANEKGEKIQESNLERLATLLTKESKNHTYRLEIGYDPNKFSVKDLQDFKNRLEQTGAYVKLIPTTEENLIDKVRGGKPPAKAEPVTQLPVNLTGEAPKDKIDRLVQKFKNLKIDGMIVAELGDIAYLTDLRGKDIDCSAVFKARAFVSKDKTVVACDPKKITQEIRDNLKGTVEFVTEKDFANVVSDFTLSSKQKMKIGYASDTTTAATYQQLKELTKGKAQLVEIRENPVSKIRSIKNKVELTSIKDGCVKSNKAIVEVMNWLEEKMQKGEPVSEKDLENEMISAHKRYGANGLSFGVIPASGSNSALIHYSEGDPNKQIKPGDLILLDTGGYYNGYASDATVTWLAGGEKGVKFLEETDPADLKEKKEIYTTAVRGALHGLFEDLKPGALGIDLDRTVRGIVVEKNKNYDYLHSTGHGTGILCHEAPPNITPSSRGMDELKERMVFSIEPGIYLEKPNPDKPSEKLPWGGVRFENLATIVKHPDPEKAEQGWHRLENLTYTPIDRNLIDESLLTQQEKEWLNEYYAKAKEALI